MPKHRKAFEQRPRVDADEMASTSTPDVGSDFRDGFHGSVPAFWMGGGSWVVTSTAKMNGTHKETMWFSSVDEFRLQSLLLLRSS